MDTAAGKHPPTPHGHGLRRFLMTVMSEIMKMAMTESMIMMIEHVCFDTSQLLLFGKVVADFPAVFFHISHWYLSWNTAGGGNCI